MQPTLGHGGWPSRPQRPPLQPLLVHVPLLSVQSWPAAMQVPLSQHPPLAHVLPAQHTLPVPPHVAQLLVESQAVPDAVQKLATVPPPPPVQQFAPVTPQVPQAPAAHVPRLPPQPDVAPMHCWPLQQAPVAEHVEFGQQGLPVPPQFTKVPAMHTWFTFEPLWPEGMHSLSVVSGQLPLKHGVWPGQSGV